MKISLLKLFLLLYFILSIVNSYAQVINGYATVTNISGNVLSLSNVDESGDSFEIGEELIIMQVQDNVIGSTANDATFGDLGSINSAGLYENLTITGITESSGTPISITVSSPRNSFNIGSNTTVQIITYPVLGLPDYTVTSAISSRAWDGNNGGVVAFQVNGTLTISQNIDADGDGFRGGFANLDVTSIPCDGGTTYRAFGGTNYGDKGEGIYNVSDFLYTAAMGRILNGGGGGNSHNGGGGGGGNYSAGGQGGPGWPNCSPSAGGLGGLDLSAHISPSRVFMGGGGGSGEGNAGNVQNGGDGGGIVLIKANEITTQPTANLELTIIFDNLPSETSWTITDESANVVASGGPYTDQTPGAYFVTDIIGVPNGNYTFSMNDSGGDGLCCGNGSGYYNLNNTNTGTSIATGGFFFGADVTNFSLSSTCTNLTISANGDTPAQTGGFGDDGNSGGGAGGAVVLEVNNWNIVGSCPLTVEANGGSGGAVTHGDIHGAGGGGGMGAVIYSIVEPTLNTTTNTQPGTGGCNSSTCTSVATTATGTNQDGIIDTSSGPLPVEWLHFYLELTKNNAVIINWATSQELNNDFFTVEKSIDGVNWESIGIINGAGNANHPRYYQFTDEDPLKNVVSYYRVFQTNFDATSSFTNVKSITVNDNAFINTIYPNPTKNRLLTIELYVPSNEVKLLIFNSKGENINPSFRNENQKIFINTSGLAKGIYMIQLIAGNKIMSRKVLIENSK